MDNIVEVNKRNAIQGMQYFLRNFSHVPDEKLNWQPTPSAKSALRIGAHTALYAGRFARMITERKLGGGENLQEWLAEREAEELAVTSRRQVEEIFRSGTEEVLKALDGLSTEDLRLDLDSGQGWSMSMAHLMSLPGWHATLHAGQIDYLQTCWDDQVVHL
jgi:hypothetical protein